MMLMHMSISGGILIILILALRMLAVKRLPKKVFVLLWEIAALRLLIPFDLPLRYGIVSPVVVHAEKAVLDVSRPAAGIIDWRMVLWILWISGIAILLFIFGIRYYRESQRLADALPVSKDEDEILRMLVKSPERVKIYVSDRTSTPLTVGMVQSRIILPKQLRADRIDLKYVLAHEMVHIRRADNVLSVRCTAGRYGNDGIRRRKHCCTGKKLRSQCRNGGNRHERYYRYQTFSVKRRPDRCGSNSTE